MFFPIPIVILIKISAINNSQILILLVTNQINNVYKLHSCRVQITAVFVMYQYYLVKCFSHMYFHITYYGQKLYSYLHYHGYTTNSVHIPAELLWLYLHFHGNTIVIVSIASVITAVLPLSPSPCHSLVAIQNPD